MVLFSRHVFVEKNNEEKAWSSVLKIDKIMNKTEHAVQSYAAGYD